jgi:Tfp pilus assembly protein PilN
MKVPLNLSTAPQENRRPFLAGAALLGTIGMIALVVLFQATYTSWQSNRDMHARIAELESRIRRASARQAELATYFRGPDAQRVLDRANFLNSLIDERSFPWTKVFATLEQTMPSGVRVVAISPKLVNGRAQVDLTIGAADNEQEIRFLQAMERSKAFSNVEITSERRSDKDNTQDRILVELKVTYETT